MNFPADLKYTKSHEWVRTEADGTLVIGITDHAQSALGDIVFIGLPDVGKQVSAGKDEVVIESVKAAADVYAPADGEVIAVNDPLPDSPEQVNQDPYGAWMFKLKPSSPPAAGALMDASAYQQMIQDEEQ
jgi:glycine cleavage system H protein